MKIKKNDTVVIIAGKDRGRKGKVLRALPKRDQVVVEGVNIRKKSQRPTRSNQKGQIIDKTLPIHASNVMVIDAKNDKPTRIGYSTDAKGKKVRIAKKSDSVLDM